MATQRYKLHELLSKAGETSAWSDAKFTCAGCRRRFQAQKFDTTLGSLCLACVEQNLKVRSRTTGLTSWSVSRMIDALAEAGPLDDRLTALWKYHEVVRLLNTQAPSRLPEFHANLVKNLGYIEAHPLAAAVRQAAFQACVTIGKPLVPTLLDLCQPTPWQFYANIIMVAGTSAPEHGGVQALIAAAARDANPEISSRAQTILHNWGVKSGSPRQDVLHSLIEALPRDLRNLVQVGVHDAMFGQSRRQANKKPGAKDAGKGAATPGKRPGYLPYQKEIEEVSNAKYSIDALKKIYDTYLRDLVSADLFPDAGRPTGQIKKHALAGLIGRVYADRDLFAQFHARLPRIVKDIITQLVWEGGEADVALLEKTYQEEIVVPTDNPRYGGAVSQDVRDAYAIFLVRREHRHDYYYNRNKGNPYNYHFTLPDPIRNAFKHALPHPPEYDLLPQKSVAATAFQYIDNDDILRQLPLFYSYIEQGHLSFSPSTGKLLKNSIKQMAQYCHVREFYDEKDKDLGFMRTKMLIEFCRAITPKEPVASDPATLRALFDALFASGKGFSLVGLLWHLQGVRNITNYYYGENPEVPVRATVRAVLKAMPPQEWLRPEDLVHYCLYRDLTLEIAPKYAAARYLSYKREVPAKDPYSYDNRTAVSAGNYKETVLLPFFKAVMFLCASFGLVDIAYDGPANATVQQAGKAYLSPFDGLRYARLTPLGAYVAGQTPAYEAAIEAEHAVITLDENRLLLTVEGQDRLKTLIIEKMAEKIGASCYRVNYQSFLRECRTTQDIRKTIELFHAHICATPPAVWQEFLQDVLSKINPLQPNQSIAIYKLADNAELRSLIARDEVLKTCVMRAENFHIAIESKHLSKVKKRLEEFGYLIDNL